MLTSIRGLVAASLIAGCAVAAAPAFADEAAPPSPITITGSAELVSQYRFRGISQSDNKPAVQMAMTVSHSSGFYISTWGSSASAGASTVNIGGTEIDVYGGYTHALGKSGLTVDMGLYGYLYPGATGGNLYEVYGSLAKAVGPATAKVGVNYAPAQKVFTVLGATSRNNMYVYGEFGSGLPGTPITIHTHLGHSGGGFNYTKPYLDYNVGAAYKYKALSFDLSLVGTNVTHGNTVANPVSGFSPAETYRASKSVLVGSVTASF